MATGYACGEGAESDVACSVTGEMSEREESEAGGRKTITGRAQSETGGGQREMSCCPAERKSIGLMTECVRFGGGVKVQSGETKQSHDAVFVPGEDHNARSRRGRGSASDVRGPRCWRRRQAPRRCSDGRK